MKHLFLATLIVVLSVNSSHAQISTILTRLTAQRALTNTNITTKTGSRSITPQNVGYSDDSIMAIMYSLAGLTGAAGDLDAVLTLGNESDLTVNIKNAGLEFKTEHAYNGIATIHDPSSSPTDYPVTFIGRLSGYNVLYLRDAFGYFGYMGAGALTADRKVLLPDEGDGVGLDATLVTHTTEDALTVTSGGNTGYYDADSMKMTDASGNASIAKANFYNVRNVAGTAGNAMTLSKDAISYAYSNSVGAVVHTSDLYFSRPSFTGITTQTLYFPSATNDTLAVKGDITSFGNFATADLTFTGNRYHNVDRYNVDIDSANMFVIQDTNGKYALNINDTANYGNSLIYVSGRTDKVVRISPSTSYLSRLFLQANATQNLGQFYAGSAQIGLTQTSSTNIIALAVGAGTPVAQLQVDSATKKVGVTHLGGLTSTPTISTGTGAGTGGTPSATVGSGSTDLSGYFSITTGTTCDPDANIITMTYNTAYSTVPKSVIIEPANKAARNLAVGQQPFASRVLQTASALILTSNTTPLDDATTYEFYYTVIQ